MKSKKDMEDMLMSMSGVEEIDQNEWSDLAEDDLLGIFEENCMNAKETLKVLSDKEKKKIDLIKNLCRHFGDAKSPPEIKNFLLKEKSTSTVAVDLLIKACFASDRNILKSVIFDRDVLNRFFDASLPTEVLKWAAKQNDVDLINWVFSPDIKCLAEAFSPIDAVVCLKLAAQTDNPEALLAILENKKGLNPYLTVPSLLEVCLLSKSFSGVSVVCHHFKGEAPLPYAVAESLINGFVGGRPSFQKMLASFVDFDSAGMMALAHDYAQKEKWGIAIDIISLASEKDYKVFVNCWQDKKPKITNYTPPEVKIFWEKADLELSVEEQKNQKTVIGPRKM